MNVQSWLRQSIKHAMIRSPLCFTGNWVANMVLNLSNTGMNTEMKGCRMLAVHPPAANRDLLCLKVLVNSVFKS